VPQSASIKTVASVVRRLRKERGWSQEDFAGRCRLHRTYVGAIERAEENITLQTLDKLAAALQVRPAQILEPALAGIGGRPAPRRRTAAKAKKLNR
jgi:transcriptional regulator with XRE-family HTH domain